jgi:hypothetical protein
MTKISEIKSPLCAKGIYFKGGAPNPEKAA